MYAKLGTLPTYLRGTDARHWKAIEEVETESDNPSACQARMSARGWYRGFEGKIGRLLSQGCLRLGGGGGGRWDRRGVKKKL